MTITLTIPHKQIGSDISRKDDFGKNLSPQEKHVLSLVFTGRENAEIAKEMNISHRSLKNYFHHIYTKLGISNSRQLFPYVIMAGFELRTGESLSLQ